ncbi:MAG TPA: cytochrome C oxidase subunit IV family protein [Candidatus Acidoferrum sp.]|nr:cytochrome C oxidase subunit IV family protein [Candidatus Acidoferrum sp.]
MAASTSDHTESHTHGAGAAHEGGHGHGERGAMGHVVPLRVLVAVWATLMVLTVLTVLVTRKDFGGDLNLIMAMLIATIKASLVCLYFMHLRWDKVFHTVVFFSALFLAILFVSITLMDSTQYQRDVTWQKDNLSPPPY